MPGNDQTVAVAGAAAAAAVAVAAIIAAATRAIDHHFDEDSVDSNVHGRWRPRSDTGETK